LQPFYPKFCQDFFRRLWIAQLIDNLSFSFGDLIVAGRYADPNGSRSGQTYVVFGASTGFGASLDLSSLTGANGFAPNGIGANDYSGRSVSGAGDVNGDGIDDFIVGAFGADPNGSASGQSYVVFGVASSPPPPPTPGVPEPATVSLLGAALGLFGLVRRRRKRPVHRKCRSG